MLLRLVYVLVMLWGLTSNPLYAVDFDDGIELDDAIDDSLKLQTNVEFIKSKVLAKVNKAKKNNGCSGTGNLTFETGANLKGATIVNLSNNKGTSAVCVTK